MHQGQIRDGLDGWILALFALLEIDNSSIMLETLMSIIDSVDPPALLKDPTGPNFYFIISNLKYQSSYKYILFKNHLLLLFFSLLLFLNWQFPLLKIVKQVRKYFSRGHLFKVKFAWR